MKKIRECLLIDDDVDDQEIFRLCITQICNDINCRTMNDAPEAVSMLSSDSHYTPDYIFLDVNMPKMNGIQCLRSLKEIERLRDCKIYIYSTTSENASLAIAKELGVNDFIIKPAKTAELRTRLSKIFEIDC